jgi:hypothetical protein
MNEAEQEQAIPTPRRKTYVTTTRLYLTVIIFSTIISTMTAAALIGAYHTRVAMKIAVYNLEEKLIQINKALAEGKITPPQADQLQSLEIADAKRIANSLPANYLMLTKGAVLGNHATNIEQ